MTFTDLCVKTLPINPSVYQLMLEGVFNLSKSGFVVPVRSDVDICTTVEAYRVLSSKIRSSSTKTRTGGIPSKYALT